MKTIKGVEIKTSNRIEAIKFLLQSIALEEAALANLINAEGKKLQTAGRDMPLDDLLKCQKSVANVLRASVKFQILLQFKLEDILEFKNRKECRCSLTGSGIAVVTNEEDFFFDKIARVLDPEVCADCGLVADSKLSYRVGDAPGIQLTLTAHPETLLIKCPEIFNPQPTPQDPNRIVIKGKAQISLKNPPDPPLTDTAKFIYTVNDGGSGPPGTDTLRMIITPFNKEELAHDSGLMELNGNLSVGLC